MENQPVIIDVQETRSDVIILINNTVCHWIDIIKSAICWGSEPYDDLTLEGLANLKQGDKLLFILPCKLLANGGFLVRFPHAGNMYFTKEQHDQMTAIPEGVLID